MKLWTTNGVVAELLVVIARVPAHDGRKGGITAFVIEGSSQGITVERRNSFMGLKGIENGLTRFHQVRVPAENGWVTRVTASGSRSPLNAGRLAIPAMCAAAGKWALKIAREWSSERVQWGRPIGEHDAVAEKIAFIAATTYGLESVLELSAQLADAGSKDIRIEAALASCGPARWRGRSPTSSCRSVEAEGTRPPSPCAPAASERCPPSRLCATCGSTASSRARARSCVC